jgi:integrase
MWHWKPSPALRKAGWTNRSLGADHAAAVAQALDLNKQVAAWRDGNTPASQTAKQPPRIIRFNELLERYQAAPEFKMLKPATQREYRVRLRQLAFWALDGNLPVRDIDTAMVQDLRSELMRGSQHRAAATLRVLRLLLNWAISARIIAINPADSVKIKEPPARRTVMGEEIRDAITAVVLDKGQHDIALAIDLAFWTLQRQADLLSFTRLFWRELEGGEGWQRAALADPRGRVMGFRIQQGKTATWVDAPVPPVFHATIEAAMTGEGRWLFPDLDDSTKSMPQWQFQRRFRAARDQAATTARESGQTDLADAIANVQFRDLRRTGMVAYSNAGARLNWITALSGHAVIGRKTIIDTYVPSSEKTEMAIACVATGLLAQQRRQQQEQQG